MDIRELTAPERDAATRVWEDAGLTRPWNDPAADFDRARARAGAQSAGLGWFDAGDLVGTVMVGDDGHRGWVYYLAVVDGHRRGVADRVLGRSRVARWRDIIVESRPRSRWSGR